MPIQHFVEISRERSQKTALPLDVKCKMYKVDVMATKETESGAFETL